MQKNFFYYLLSLIIIGVLSTLVMVPITTYYLNPKDFGIFAIANAITMPIGPLASTGVSWVLAGNYYTIDKKERKVLFFNILLLDFALKSFWILVFWLSTPLLLPLIIKDFELKYIFYFKLSLLAALSTTFWPSVSYLIVLQRKGRSHAILEISQWAGGALVTIICLTILKLSTIALFLGPLASGVISCVAGLWYVRDSIEPKVSKKWLIEIFKVGIPSIPTNLFEMITNISDRYFIQRWSNLSQLGIYSHSLNYKSIFTMGSRSFTRTFSPYALEVFSKGLDRKNIAQKIIKWYGLLGITGVFITLFSYEIVNALTHGKFVSAAPLIPIWFLLVFSFAYGAFYTQFLVVHKKNAFMVYSGLFISGSFLGITAIFIYKFGIMGGVVSIVLSNFMIQLSRRIYAAKLACEPIGENEFLSIVAILLGVYIVNRFFHLSILEKALAGVLLSAFIAYRYHLIEVFRLNSQRALAYLTAWKLKKF